jgi:very-short-patch-repair endonuclease
MSDLHIVLDSAAGVASLAYLETRGVPRRDIDHGLRAGSVFRVRQGWVATPTARPDVVQAVRVGGVLTCQSVLRRHGVWCDDDRLLHVRVGRHTTHLSAPHDRSLPLGKPGSRGVRLHRTIPGNDGGGAGWGVDSLETAVVHLFQCEARDNVIVSLDSVLNKRLLTYDRLEELASVLPKRFRAFVMLTDAAAQSGLETKARLGLRRHGIPYRSQVAVERVGHVDLLIGDRLVLEVDGEAWHSGPLAYSEDRRRDLELMRRGFIVMRVSYAQVMNQWVVIEEVIRSLVARREHLWAARHRRAGLTGA